VVIPSASSWGDKGYYDVWLNGGNDWIYRHLHVMAIRMEEVSNRYAQERNHIKIRMLNQLLRELLLAQSSDWAFLMTTQTAMEYSIRRTKEHISNFTRLYEMITSGTQDIGYLEWLEYKNSIFMEIDYRVFS
jgi:1,4-alpha-glucan branching enzyme